MHGLFFILILVIFFIGITYWIYLNKVPRIEAFSVKNPTIRSCGGITNNTEKFECFKQNAVEQVQYLLDILEAAFRNGLADNYWIFDPTDPTVCPSIPEPNYSGPCSGRSYPWIPPIPDNGFAVLTAPGGIFDVNNGNSNPDGVGEQYNNNKNRLVESWKYINRVFLTEIKAAKDTNTISNKLTELYGTASQEKSYPVMGDGPPTIVTTFDSTGYISSNSEGGEGRGGSISYLLKRSDINAIASGKTYGGSEYNTALKDIMDKLAANDISVYEDINNNNSVAAIVDTQKAALANTQLGLQGGLFGSSGTQKRRATPSGSTANRTAYSADQQANDKLKKPDAVVFLLLQ